MNGFNTRAYANANGSAFPMPGSGIISRDLIDACANAARWKPILRQPVASPGVYLVNSAIPYPDDWLTIELPCRVCSHIGENVMLRPLDLSDHLKLVHKLKPAEYVAAFSEHGEMAQVAEHRVPGD